MLNKLYRCHIYQNKLKLRNCITGKRWQLPDYNINLTPFLQNNCITLMLSPYIVKIELKVGMVYELALH